MSIVTERPPAATGARGEEPRVRDRYRFVLGVDTHAANHVYGLVSCPHGIPVDVPQGFPTSDAGIGRALGWLGRRTGGDITGTVVVIEGTGSYGAVVAARLAEQGYRVVEAPTPKRDKGRPKNDALDAVAVAELALKQPISMLRDRRGGGDPDAASAREAMQVLLTAREEDNQERTRAINELTALLRAHPLGIDARRALTHTQIREVAGWRTRTEPVGAAVARTRAIRLARRSRELDEALATNHRQLKDLVLDQAAPLLDLHGVGPVTAAVAITVWSHPGRIRTEAAFAAIAGTSPIEISSGNNEELRLNRGGDRRLNCAINTIALTRARSDERTRAYIQRRRTEGMTHRRIRRCLKRYIARELYRTLNAIHHEQGVDAT
jgi:transposase